MVNPIAQALQPLQPFLWGRGGAQMTPEQIAREREIAEALGVVDTSPVDHWLQGAARMANAAVGRVREGRASAAERDNAAYNQDVIAGLLGGTTPASIAPELSSGFQSNPAQTTSAATIPTGERADYIRQGLLQRGLPPHVADAFILNFQDESGLNPGINERNPIVPGSRGGFGLYQLTGPRRREYEAFAAQRGVPLDDIDAQLDFLMQEGQGSERQAFERILAAPDTATAAQAIVNDFLRPAESHRRSRASRYSNLASSASPAGGVLEALASGSMGVPVAETEADILAQEAAMAQQDPNTWAGMGRGTLSANNRPMIPNADGTVSTEESITVTDPRLNGGRPTNIPSIWGGRRTGSEDEAVEMALGSGQKFQSFGSIGEAVSAAQARSDMLGDAVDRQTNPIAAALTNLPVNPDMPMAGNTSGFAPIQQQAQQQPMGGINPAIIQALSDPRASEQTRQIAGLLLNQQMQAQDPMRQLEMQIAKEKLNQMRNPAVEPTDTMRNLEWRAAQAGLQPGTPEYNQFMITGGRNDGITVNNMGNIPAGYQLTTDSETGAQRMEPIPGSPAAMELAEAERMRGEREGQGQRYGRIVLEDIGRVLEAVESNPNLVAGPLGSMLSNLPGTGAHDVSSMLNTIRANVGFDRLQAMRASSPTGGALGAVSDSENRMLQSTLGALEQSQSPQQFAQNLRRLQNLYTEIVHGPAPTGVSDDEWSRRAWGVQSQDGGNRPLSEMSDEELEAIVNGNR